MFLFTSICLKSQQHTTDLPYQNVIDAPNDSVKITRLCINYSIALSKREFGVSEECFNEALILIEKTGYYVGINNLIVSVENFFTKRGNYKKALDLLFKLKKTAETIHYQKGYSNMLGSIGVLYWRLGDTDNALVFFNEELKIAEKTNIKHDVASVYNNLGLVYRQMNKLDKALNYYTKAMQLFLEANVEEGLTDTYNNIGVVYQFQENYTKANYYFNKSLQLCLKNKDSVGISIALGNLGVIQMAQLDLLNAEKNLLLSFGISERQSDLEGIKEVGFELSNLYEQKKQTDKALSYFRKYIQARDTLNDEAFRKEALIKEMEFKFEKEKEKKAILVEADKKRQQLYTVSVAVILALVLLFSALLYKRFALIKKQKEIIESQKQTVEEKQKEITDSIHYAKRIQSALLAHAELLKKNLPDHFVLFKPKDIVSGDFYWATSTSSAGNGKFYLAVCDSTGHGVPGAFMSLLNISFLNEAINEKSIMLPNEVLNHVRKRLIENISQEGAQDGMDGVLIKFENPSKKIIFSAANNAPVLIRNNQLVELSCDKMPVGKSTRVSDFNEYSYDLIPGDMLYIYTDGYADQFGGPKGKKFKYNQLHQLLVSIANVSVAEQKNLLENKFNEWKGQLEQVDDVCIIGIKIS